MNNCQTSALTHSRAWQIHLNKRIKIIKKIKKSWHIQNKLVPLQCRIGGLSTPTDKGNPTALPTFAFCWS